MDTQNKALEPISEPILLPADKKPKREDIVPQREPQSEKKAWFLVSVLCKLIYNVEHVLKSMYSLAKTTLKFWWIVVLGAVIIYPKPLLELVEGVLRIVETIKNLIN